MQFVDRGRRRGNRGNRGGQRIHQPRRQTHRSTREAPPIAPPQPHHLEVGAGEGDYSAAYRNQYARRGQRYVASDIAPEAGRTGFLTVSRAHGVESQYGVNALEVGNNFGQGRGRPALRQVIATNPYGGGQRMPGVGFGLMQYTPVPEGAPPERAPDSRFIASALPAVGREGQVRLMGRSNALTLALRDRGVDEAERPEQLHATNPYLNIRPAELGTLATQTGSRIHVTSAHPPRVRRIGGGAPDTPHRGGLGDYNTQFLITSAPTHPGVTYSHGRHVHSTSPPTPEPRPALAPRPVRRVRPSDSQERAEAYRTGATFRNTSAIPRDREGGRQGRGTRAQRGGRGGRDLRDAIDLGLEDYYGDGDWWDDDDD